MIPFLVLGVTIDCLLTCVGFKFVCGPVAEVIIKGSYMIGCVSGAHKETRF